MKAIVYTSNTGHTEKYAKLLSEKTGLPVYSLKESKGALNKGDEIIYMGWLFASSVKGYKKAARRYKIAAVCGVGLCETGYLLDEVRKAIKLPAATPLFTLQGGIDRSRLKGINKSMINMLTKMTAAKDDPTEDDKRMLELLTHDADYVSADNMTQLLDWYNSL